MPYPCAPAMVVADPPGGDDATNLQAALDLAATLRMGVALHPGATYTVNARANDTDVLRVTADTRLDMCGATIRLTPNPYPKVRLLSVTGGAHLRIRGGTLRGDRLAHDYTATGTHEFGYGLYVDGGHLTVTDVEAYDFTGDGACIVGDATNTARFVRFHTHHNRRQGVSVLAFGTVTFDDCHIHDIGTSDGIAGTAPMSGIDVEPASRSMRVERVTVRDTRIDCAVKGLVTSHTLAALLVDGSSVRGQVLHGAAGKATFRDSEFEWDYIEEFAIPSFGDARATGVTIRANRWQIAGHMRDSSLTNLPDPAMIPRLWIGADAVLEGVTIDPAYTVEDARP